jgi:aquaporin Z
LIGIPVTNLSVNPARSTGPAIFVGDWAIAELWLFWVAPIIGGILGGALYAQIFESRDRVAEGSSASKGRVAVVSR